MLKANDIFVFGGHTSSSVCGGAGASHSGGVTIQSSEAAGLGLVEELVKTLNMLRCVEAHELVVRGTGRVVHVSC